MSNDMMEPDFSSGVTPYTAGDSGVSGGSGVSGISVAPKGYSSTIAKPAVAKKSELINIYVVLLFIALGAIVLGTLMLALEWGRYDYETEPTVQFLPAVNSARELSEWI